MASASALPRVAARRSHTNFSSRSLAATWQQQAAVQRRRHLLLCAAAGEGSETAEPEGQPAAQQGGAAPGPRDDDVLPDSLTGALEDASQATVEALERGVDRCVVGGPGSRRSREGWHCNTWGCSPSLLVLGALHPGPAVGRPCRPANRQAPRQRGALSQTPPPYPLPTHPPTRTRRWRCCCPSCGTR